MEETQTHFKDKVFKTLIHRNVKLAEAPSYGKSILDYDNNSKGGFTVPQFSSGNIRKRQKKKKHPYRFNPKK